MVGIHGVSMPTFWKENVPGRRNSKETLVCSRNSEVPGTAGEE